MKQITITETQQLDQRNCVAGIFEVRDGGAGRDGRTVARIWVLPWAVALVDVATGDQVAVYRVGDVQTRIAHAKREAFWHYG